MSGGRIYGLATMSWASGHPNKLRSTPRIVAVTGQLATLARGMIRHLVYRNEQLGGVARVRNPLPAEGGANPETVDQAKWHAPQQFKQPRRAIVAADYADLAMTYFANRIQRARATMRWIGFGYEVQVAIDPKSHEQNLTQLTKDVEARLAEVRRIGHRLKVELPKYVGLRIDMTVCVSAGHLRSHVHRELLERFSNRVASDGTLGFFHPDKFTFGDELYLSHLITAARQIEGVENVDITLFERYGQGNQGELDAGVMKFGPLEIPRLDSDPRRPEFGRFSLDVRGQR